ncbi:MAG: hypothetical protein AABX23_02380 [Nanoarchaeota archaeon]
MSRINNNTYLRTVYRLAFGELDKDDDGHFRKRDIIKQIERIRDAGYTGNYDGLNRMTQEDLLTFLLETREKIKNDFLRPRT